MIIILIILTLFVVYLYHKIKYNSLNAIKNTTQMISIYRPVESNALRNVKNIVTNIMNSMRLTVTEQYFIRNINYYNYTFSNLIAINPNAKPPYILLGAHIDSPQINGVTSAIDAATSIAIILELVKNLLVRNPYIPLMIVFFDGEEAIDGMWSNNNTLSGSTYFVNNMNYNISKAYIFDLIGGDINNNKIAQFYDNMNTYSDFKQLSEINKKYDNIIFMDPDVFISQNTIINDSTPFVRNKMYALNLIPYKFPTSHHTLEDNYNNVNWDYVDVFYKVMYEFLENNV
jgi:hypothetical protein